MHPCSACEDDEKLWSDVIDPREVGEMDCWRRGFVRRKCMLFLRKDGDVGSLGGCV